jgi:hypothetical protein
MEKKRITEVLDGLPDDIDLNALIERLYVLKRLELAEEEIAAGKVLEHDQVEQRFASWLE